MIRTILAPVRNAWHESSPGERCALLLFAFVCFQAVFRQPYVIITREVSANLFAGLICLASLLAAYCCTPGMGQRLRSPATVFCLALLGLVLAAGFTSQDPATALSRGLVLWSSGCGGYWSARLLLQTPERRSLFAGYCALLMGGFLALSLVGLLLQGSVHAFFDPYRHPQVSLSLLLAFAPLSCLLGRESRWRVAAWALLGTACLVLFLSGLRVALVMPVLLAGVVLLLGTMRLRSFLLLAGLSALLAGAFLLLFPEKRLHLAHESLYYRVENYPFSLSIAREHPWLGIGLGVPRTAYLENYTLRYPHVERESFRFELEKIKVSENILLTFLTGLGLPFTLLYCGGVALIYGRLFKAVRRKAFLDGLPALAVFLSVTAGLGHFLLYDGLLHPQVSWFFHVLLGLAPLGATAREEPPHP